MTNGVLVPCVKMGESFCYLGCYFYFNNNNNNNIIYLDVTNCYLQFVHQSIAKLIKLGGIVVQYV